MLHGVTTKTRHFSGDLHLHSNSWIRTTQPEEGKHGHLACCKLEIHQLKLGGLDILTEHHPCSKLNEVEIQCLRHKWCGSGSAHVALDDLHSPHGAAAPLHGHELYVERT